MHHNFTQTPTRLSACVGSCPFSRCFRSLMQPHFREASAGHPLPSPPHTAPPPARPRQPDRWRGRRSAACYAEPTNRASKAGGEASTHSTKGLMVFVRCPTRERKYFVQFRWDGFFFLLSSPLLYNKRQRWKGGCVVLLLCSCD